MSEVSIVPSWATWFTLPDFASAQALTDRIGVFCRLCDGTRSWEWSRVYEKPAGAPTQFAVPCDLTVRDRVWSVAATAQNNSAGIVAAAGAPLFRTGELALLTLVDVSQFVEHADPVEGGLL